MQAYSYQLVNVFAETHFGGNPLAVFPDADELTTGQMQLIARQFNLSETVFCQTATEKGAVKKLRIFTPGYEMPFAGHPTIGAAFVLHRQLGLAPSYRLQTNSGLVTLQHRANQVTFALNNGVQIAPAAQTKNETAKMLGLNENEIVEAHWVNTGTKQLLIQVDSPNAVENCHIDPFLFHRIVKRQCLYLWYVCGDNVKVRLFFGMNGAVLEDPGTGSAAANLGGWCAAKGQFPIHWQITQGDEIQRPNRLTLDVDENQTIYVGGQVILVGSGEFFVE